MTKPAQRLMQNIVRAYIVLMMMMMMMMTMTTAGNAVYALMRIAYKQR